MPFKSVEREKEYQREYSKRNRKRLNEYRKKLYEKERAKENNYFSSFNCRYSRYKHNSRKIGFYLSKKEFQEFWQKPCYYCGDEIKTIGLDRLDNDKPYEIGNVTPCCKRCNFFKGVMSKEDFLNLCQKITKTLRG